MEWKCWLYEACKPKNTQRKHFSLNLNEIIMLNWVAKQQNSPNIRTERNISAISRQHTHTHTIKSCSVSKCIIIYNVWNVNIFIMIVKVIKLSQWTNWQHWSLAMMIDAQMKSELKQHPTTTMSTQNSGNSSHADSQQKQQHPQKKLAA